MSQEPTVSYRHPAPPKPPVPGECCERGCENCVWVFYYEAQRRHEATLRALAAAPADPG
ncbi:MAG: oxidoreductase-like domain-containing protein [Candidatus Contendobacter sp.]|nr:oxidoreductase-like domain-containing protein [Candidatus Contendobacter sp.]